MKLSTSKRLSVLFFLAASTVGTTSYASAPIGSSPTNSESFRVAALNKNTLWVTDHSGEVLRTDDASTPTPNFSVANGNLKEIAAGPETWGVTRQGDVYKYVGAGKWAKQSGSLSHISVSRSGLVSGANAAGNAFRRFPNGTWSLVPTPQKIKELHVDSRGWGIALTQAGNTLITKGIGQAWVNYGGVLKSLAVGSGTDNYIWGVNEQGNIYRLDLTEKSWKPIPGNLQDISIGTDNSIWGINDQGRLYRFVNNGFQKMSSALAYRAAQAPFAGRSLLENSDKTVADDNWAGFTDLSWRLPASLQVERAARVTEGAPHPSTLVGVGKLAKDFTFANVKHKISIFGNNEEEIDKAAQMLRYVPAWIWNQKVTKRIILHSTEKTGAGFFLKDYSSSVFLSRNILNGWSLGETAGAIMHELAHAIRYSLILNDHWAEYIRIVRDEAVCPSPHACTQNAAVKDEEDFAGAFTLFYGMDDDSVAKFSSKMKLRSKFFIEAFGTHEQVKRQTRNILAPVAENSVRIVNPRSGRCLYAVSAGVVSVEGSCALNDKGIWWTLSPSSGSSSIRSAKFSTYLCQGGGNQVVLGNSACYWGGGFWLTGEISKTIEHVLSRDGLFVDAGKPPQPYVYRINGFAKTSFIDSSNPNHKWKNIDAYLK